MTGARFLQRRATAAQWAAKNPVLGDGEFGIEKDTGIIKVGDGVTSWTLLEAAFESQFLPMLGTAADSAKLGGLAPSSYAKATDLSAYLKTADASTTYATNAVVDGRTLQTSATRKLSTHWGTMTSFPTTGVLPGDTVLRSDIGTGGSIWVYFGPGKGSGGWVHKGVLACTSTTRPATAVCYIGLQIFETDTLKAWFYSGTASPWYLLQVVSDTGWIDMTSGVANGYTVGTDGAHYRVINGVCFFQVHCGASTAVGGATFFTLPVGSRPTFVQWYLGSYGGVVKGEFKVNINGTMAFTAANTTFVVTGSFPVG